MKMQENPRMENPGIARSETLSDVISAYIYRHTLYTNGQITNPELLNDVAAAYIYRDILGASGR